MPAANPTTVDTQWYLYAITGAVNALMGVLVLAYPDPSVKLLGVFLGIDLLIVAAVLVVRGVSKGSDGPVDIVIGILALIAGVIAIRNPEKSLLLLVLVFAIYLIAHGAVVLSRGLINRDGRWTTLAQGAVLTTFGTVILCWPDLSLTTLAILAGISLLLHGVVELAEAFALRSAG